MSSLEFKFPLPTEIENEYIEKVRKGESKIANEILEKMQKSGGNAFCYEFGKCIIYPDELKIQSPCPEICAISELLSESNWKLNIYYVCCDEYMGIDYRQFKYIIYLKIEPINN